MATRFVTPIKRSLTAVGYLIVGGLSRYAYQVDSFRVLKFFLIAAKRNIKTSLHNYKGVNVIML